MTRAYNTATTQQNSGGAVAGFVAGKNRIINGDFRINQRNFTGTSGANAFYPVDRWMTTTAGSHTFSLQTFTPGAAPVAGYEGTTFFQIATVGGSGHYALLGQKIEDVRTFAGQTITVSFWAKATSGTPKIGFDLTQLFGSGGSSQASTNYSAFTLSTSWARYSATVAVPSISGKTIGTNSSLLLDITFTNDYNPVIGQQTATFQLWGVQAEVGSTATPFTTATGTIQGELAACQRYYWRTSYDSTYTHLGSGIANTTTALKLIVPLPVQLRTVPSSFDWAGSGGLMATDGVNNLFITAIAGDGGYTSRNIIYLNCTFSGATQFRSYQVALGGAGNTTQYLGCSAEL